ncbi:MAG: HNH endonuclease [Verrucomicrobiia bacterium]
MAINAQSHCVLKDGKPRIRQLQSVKNAHPASLIAAAMMLPKPRRERHLTSGTRLLRWEQFVVQTVRIDVVPRADSVLIRPVIVRLENGDDRRLDINFADRMTRVVRVWAAAATGDEPISEAVRAHAAAFTSPLSTQAQLVAAFFQLHAALAKPKGDMLPILETRFGLTASESIPLEAVVDETVDEEFTEIVHIDPLEARVERVRQWRLCAVRGGTAASFRRSVREAYDWRCLFSGQRLPLTEATLTPGVDAAHILPWSRFDIDAVANGLCLSKQCHWAFDTGLFRLNFDDNANVYVVSIPDPVRLAAEATRFDLASFHASTGPIPRNRLPANEALWPSRLYLAELNRFIEGEAT